MGKKQLYFRLIDDIEEIEKFKRKRKSMGYGSNLEVFREAYRKIKNSGG